MLINNKTASGLLRKLRNDPSFLLTRLPPWISLVCILVGVASLLVLPLDEYSRGTYISENALLPGQVHTYFAGSEQNIFRGYKRELETVIPAESVGEEGENGEQWKVVSDTVQGIFRAAGLKVATQNYEYVSAGNVHKGQNVYSIIHAPRGDATEAIVLVAAWRTIEGELNLNGVTLALTLARYFKSMLPLPLICGYMDTDEDRMVPLVKRHHLPHHPRQQSRLPSLDRRLPRHALLIRTTPTLKEWRITRRFGY